MPDLSRPPVTVEPAPVSESEGSLITTWWPARHPFLVAPAVSALAIAAMFAFPQTAAHASIIFCAWAVIPTFLYGGFLPGLLVTVLTCVAADYFFIAPNGSLWIADSLERLRFLDSVVLLIVGSAIGGLFRRQLTLRGKREMALRASEARYRGLLEQASDAVLPRGAGGQPSSRTGARARCSATRARNWRASASRI